MQNYLKSTNISTEETQMLAALRSNCVRNVRMNFPKILKNLVYCPLKCEQHNQIEDTQEHLLQYKKFNTTNIERVKIDDDYACIAKQTKVDDFLLNIY